MGSNETMFMARIDRWRGEDAKARKESMNRAYEAKSRSAIPRIDQRMKRETH